MGYSDDYVRFVQAAGNWPEQDKHPIWIWSKECTRWDLGARSATIGQAHKSFLKFWERHKNGRYARPAKIYYASQRRFSYHFQQVMTLRGMAGVREARVHDWVLVWNKFTKAPDRYLANLVILW